MVKGHSAPRDAIPSGMPPIWLGQSAGIAPWGVTPQAARGVNE